MTEALEYRARDGSITHIKVWGDAGDGRATVLWASEKPLVGRTFDMDDEEYALFGTWDMVSGVTDLRKEENLLERSAGQLVEVYAATRDAAGVPIIFEVYISMAGLNQSMKYLIGVVLPLPLAALIVLSLATLPLAVSLAQQGRPGPAADAAGAGQRGRASGTSSVVGSPRTCMTGWSRTWRASAMRWHPRRASCLPAGRNDITSTRPARSCAGTWSRCGHSWPRSTPRTSRRRAWRRRSATWASVFDLGPDVAEARDRRAVESAPLDGEAGVPRDPGGPGKRGQACPCLVGCGDGSARRTGSFGFEVVDDGVGFDPSLGSPEGHFGLRLISEMVADSGGKLSLESSPGAGTAVRCAVAAVTRYVRVAGPA